MIQKTLVTSPRITPDGNSLMEVARSLGQPALRLQNFHPTDELLDTPIAVYDWLVKLPETFTKRSVIKTTLGEAREINKPYFVKNADGMKSFEAKIYQSGGELPPNTLYPDDYEVLVSEPVAWEVEYRCFIRDRTLATLSIYLIDGEIARTSSGSWIENAPELKEAHDFCQTLLDDSNVAIPPACVIDVGRIAGSGWAVVEANPAYGSGIYGCDPKHVLHVINRSTLHVDDITEIDLPWITRYEVED